MNYNETTLKQFRPAMSIKENTHRINSLEFSKTGETLITSSDDETMVIYDCRQGRKEHKQKSGKYGIDLVRFTNEANNVIHASTKVNSKSNDNIELNRKTLWN